MCVTLASVRALHTENGNVKLWAMPCLNRQHRRWQMPFNVELFRLDCAAKICIHGEMWEKPNDGAIVLEQTHQKMNCQRNVNIPKAKTHTKRLKVSFCQNGISLKFPEVIQRTFVVFFFVGKRKMCEQPAILASKMWNIQQIKSLQWRVQRHSRNRLLRVVRVMTMTMPWINYKRKKKHIRTEVNGSRCRRIVSSFVLFIQNIPYNAYNVCASACVIHPMIIFFSVPVPDHFARIANEFICISTHESLVWFWSGFRIDIWIWWCVAGRSEQKIFGKLEQLLLTTTETENAKKKEKKPSRNCPWW